MRVLPADSNVLGGETPTTYTVSNAPSKNIFVRSWRAYERGLGKAVAVASKAYMHTGTWTWRYPILMLSITSVVTLLICVGWMKLRIDNSTNLCEYWISPLYRIDCY